MARIAINGLGRIGRAAFKVIMDTDGLDLVAVNDLLPAKHLAYLLKFDTVYGRYNRTVEAHDNKLVVDGHEVAVFAERDPAQLPWGKHEIDLVIESTGLFTQMEKAKLHLDAGAKQVIISAPTKSPELATVVHGVAHPDAPVKNIFSCASCTTNSITPVVEIMGRRIGVKKAILNTIHAYTASQALVDGPSKDERSGRAAAQNMVPSSTGAAIATTKVLPQFAGKFDGRAVRVPTPVGSLSDITFVTERPTSVEEINKIFEEEAAKPQLKEVLGINTEQIASSDIIGDTHAGVVDLTLTQVVDGDLVKVFVWYDNEWGYTNQMIREAKAVLGV